MSQVKLNEEQRAMLRGKQGQARQMGMRLLLDMAAAAGATQLVPIQSAHLSGVSPLTGGLGLRLFLARLVQTDADRVAVPTTLNAAGCDPDHFEQMRIVAPDFLAHSQEIVDLYSRLGVRPTQSCIPYEWEGVVTTGVASWAESNAICFGNSYTGLITNRESGLSALAAALTGYTPQYGLLEPDARRPNLDVEVTCQLSDPTDFSLLGDWIGLQRQPNWRMPLGPIPLIRGLPAEPTHDQRKALSAAAANFGCPLLYIEGVSPDIPEPRFQQRLRFGATDLVARYQALAPRQPVSLIVIGCPQASVSELRAVAEQLRGRRVSSGPDGEAPPLWLFTSSHNLAIAERTGIAQAIRDAGALLLAHTCPEVVPYDHAWVKHILTNSMKAEHYIKSGLNGIPTSVMRLADCMAVASGERLISDEDPANDAPSNSPDKIENATKIRQTGASESNEAPGQDEELIFAGKGLPSQRAFAVTGQAFVTDTPITLLGFVNRETGVIEEPGHPADGQSMAGRIAIFPKGSGSTVAPYVLLELHYRGNAPLAIANTDIDQQSAPACSLENIPYGYGFDARILQQIQHGDRVEMRRDGDRVTLRRLPPQG